jgi:hypothetical protein
MLVAACAMSDTGAGPSESDDQVRTARTTTTTTSASISTSETLPSSTTTTQATQTSVTVPILDTSGAVLHEIADYGFAMTGPHVASTFAPAAGWVVTQSPSEFGVWFPGVRSPDTLVIGGNTFNGPGYKDWGADVELTYDHGVNQVSITVTRGTNTIDVSVPVTYLPDATVTLVKVIAVDAATISLDYGYWDPSGEFPSPADDDPGIVETIPVDPNAYVILDATVVADYAWFVNEYNRQTPHDDLGWYPGGDWTVYWATVNQGELVELWHIPVG